MAKPSLNKLGFVIPQKTHKLESMSWKKVF